MKALLAAAALLAACDGRTGTVALELTTAPGSTVLDAVDRLRLTLTNPRAVFESVRTSSGFDVVIDVEANGELGTLIVEGLDGAGTVVATGMSPRFQINAIDARIVIYVAAPMSIELSPQTLGPARAGVAGAALAYGVIFAGGRDATGTASDAIAIYNAFDHSLTGGMTMPIARSDLVIGANATGGVYLYGGTLTGGTPSTTLLGFDTTTPPDGSYLNLGEFPGFARSDQQAILIAPDRFLITGAPALELAGGELAARTEVAELSRTAATVTPPDGLPTAVFVGPSELVRFRSGNFDTLAGGNGRARATIATLPAGKLAVVGGGDATIAVRDALLIDAATGAVTVVPDVLATGRFAPAAAANDRYLVVAGGTDLAGTPIATAEIFDATTLAPLRVVPIVPRAGTRAFPLPNGQILIAGGTEPNDVIELFTPDAPIIP